MITLDQVPLWVLTRGVGCIVTSSDTRWHRTPHSLIIGGETTKKQPKRICSKCRAALSELSLPKKA